MATTLTLISTVTISTANNTISFTNIPQTYTDLMILASLRGSTTTTTFGVQVNGSTVTSVRRFYGTGSSMSFDSFNEHYIDPSNFTSSVFGNTELYFPNYTDALTKTYMVDSVGENNSTEAYMNFSFNLTGSTSAITSINLIRTSGDFVQYSTASLYGISNA